MALWNGNRDEDRNRMIHAGFTTHVPKPLEPPELIRTIGHISGRSLLSAK